MTNIRSTKKIISRKFEWKDILLEDNISTDYEFVNFNVIYFVTFLVGAYPMNTPGIDFGVNLSLKFDFVA